jgi:ferredoxin
MHQDVTELLERSLMRLRLDFDACTGHGRCYALAPELFEADDEGYGKLVISSGDVPLDLTEPARKAVNNCPERAISLDDRPAG